MHCLLSYIPSAKVTRASGLTSCLTSVAGVLRMIACAFVSVRVQGWPNKVFAQALSASRVPLYVGPQWACRDCGVVLRCAAVYT